MTAATLTKPPARRVEPTVGLLKGGPYTPASHTDIRATLDKAREQLKESKQ